MDVKVFDVVKGGENNVGRRGDAGRPLCWTVSMLSENFSIMINVSILSEKLLVEKESHIRDAGSSGWP